MNKRLLVVLIAIGALAAPGVAQADVVTDWNKTMVDALYATHTGPQPSTRIAAIVQASVFDAVNGLSGRYDQFHPEVLDAAAPPGASRRAAAAGAAYTALSALLPAQQAAFDAQYAATLASLPASESVERGLAWGRTVANAIVAWRSTDGFTAVLPPYVIGALPFWQPTPPAFVATPVFRQFATMTPWTMSSPGQFLPPPPPALTSVRYTTDFNETKSIGSAATATPANVETAKFWNGQFDTVVTMWNRVAESLVTNKARLVDNARLFALVNVSMADAVIAIFNAKNTYNAWRPVTAIRNADIDNNPDTAQDTTWTSVLPAPAHQEYPSGHTGLSSAAASVLASFFGNRTTFTLTSDGLPPAPSTGRTYARFSDAIDEVTLARVAAGIHFRFSCDVAAEMGAEIAQQAVDTEMERAHGHD